MKNAFTLLELVFVIVIVGIIATFAMRQTPSDHLDRAAIQLLSHIKYTQHLALKQDFYNPNDSNWFKRRWRFGFSKGIGTNEKWAYTIWADTAGNATGSPDPKEIAINPSDTTKRLTGGFNGNLFIHTNDPRATKEMNLGEAYGILDVKFSAPCRTGAHSKSIAFDHVGRPLRGALENYIAPYKSSIKTNILLLKQCQITICIVDNCDNANEDEKRVIAIEPETGYAHFL